VEINVSTIIGPINLDVGQVVQTALNNLVDQGAIPSTDTSEWPEGTTIEFDDNNPLSIVSDPKLVDLAGAEEGGPDFKKYRNNIRSMVIKKLLIKIRENTLNYDTGPLTILAGEEGSTADDLVEIASMPDGIEKGYTTPDSYDQIPLNEHQKKVIGTFIDLDKFLVGLKAVWTGTLQKDSELPDGVLSFDVRIEITVMANPL